MTWHETGGNQDDPRVKEIAQELGLNHGFVRTFMQRWQGFLTARLLPEHPIFGLWALYAKDPSADFSKMSGEISQQLTETSEMTKTLLPVVADKFRTASPQNMKEVVDRYCQLLVGNAPDTAEVRRVLDEPGSPVKVTIDETVGTFDQGERNQLTNLRNKIEDVHSQAPGAPPEAMVMVDNPTPHDPHIFIRGNPGSAGRCGRSPIYHLPRFAEIPRSRRGAAEELAENHKSRQPVNKSCDGQSPLALAFRTRAGDGDKRLWYSRGFTKPSRTPRLSRFGIRRCGLVDQSHAASHDGVRDLPAIKRGCVDGRNDDPENELLWAFRRRRIELEELRDSLLNAAGELDTRICGRSVPIVGDNPSNRRIFLCLH